MKAVVDFTHPARPDERHRFDSPRIVLRATTPVEVLPLLDAVDRATKNGAWAVGFVAYEAAPAFDDALPVRARDPDLPLAMFAIYDAPAVSGPAPAEPSAGFSVAPWHGGPSPERFDAQIAAIRSGIADGAYYQVNLTARYAARFDGAAAALYAALREAQPQSFGLFLDDGAVQVASVSPELFFERTGDRILVRPMKGTAARHADPARDADARESLRQSDKERAENLMIVDLLRNDLSRVALTGSVRVPRLFELEALPTAWQMTSTVECEARPEATLAELFGALFPCGSITGAPKRAAMQAIADLEDAPRGVYCGALGLVRPGGDATFSVGIRSVVVRQDRAVCGIGSGVTLDSTAPGEWDEWAVKRRFLWRATAPFELLETLRLEDGVVPRCAGHVERMLASARHFGFPVARAAIDAALGGVLARHPAGRHRVRLLADRLGRVRAEAFAFDPAPDPPGEAGTAADRCAVFTVATSPVDADPELSPDLLWNKTTERRHYPAPSPGVFDVLLWNRAGFVTEFGRGNLVYEWQGRRYTPPADGTLLPGVLRAELLARGEVAERPLAAEDLPRCARLWFINSLRGEIPVVPAVPVDPPGRGKR
jgi:para-aminobenzoate synthetase / 4-amino-4-deoxychorismate lyase